MARLKMKFDTSPKKKLKTKLMLWIEVDHLERLNKIKPKELTTQECIRQIITDYLNG